MRIWPSDKPMVRPAGLRLTVFTLWIIAVTALALAEEPTPSRTAPDPIRVSADRLVSESQARTAEFSGNVKAVQAQTTILADHLRLIYREGQSEEEGVDADNIETIEAWGNVRITFDNRVAVTQKAVYTTNDRRLVLSGPNTRITSGQDVISGSRITFYRESGRVEIVGDDDNQVKATIHSGETGLN